MGALHNRPGKCHKRCTQKMRPILPTPRVHVAALEVVHLPEQERLLWQGAHCKNCTLGNPPTGATSCADLKFGSFTDPPCALPIVATKRGNYLSQFPHTLSLPVAVCMHTHTHTHTPFFVCVVVSKVCAIIFPLARCLFKILLAIDRVFIRRQGSIAAKVGARSFVCLAERWVRTNT